MNILGFIFLGGFYALLFFMGYYNAKGMDNSLLNIGFIMVVFALVIQFLMSLVFGNESEE